MRIAFIGNFVPPFSTENERKWSFEKLGHEVITLQENTTSPEAIESLVSSVDMLIYSHTHGWEIKGLESILEAYKKAGVPTVSVHLDRWAWLDRVKDMGAEATWKCEYIFMADGSPEAVELYEKLDLNWHWLKPGVVERACYVTEPNHDKFPHEIVFIGSRGYHPEYEWRPKLIDWLQETYGDRFGLYGNDGIKVVRQHELNVLCSTAKIVVGDSCFGGRPRYVSDRYYEVRGRNGFLIHPHVEGIETHGVIDYKQDFGDLRFVIDYWLKNDYQREAMRKAGFEWVKENETYTQRSQTILDTIYGP
jgi:spore maturation protein CgeB